MMDTLEHGSRIPVRRHVLLPLLSSPNVNACTTFLTHLEGDTRGGILGSRDEHITEKQNKCASKTWNKAINHGSVALDLQAWRCL